MAAGESADITTATDNKGEGRFIEELHSVSVRTQRPNRHNSARAEKFHGVSFIRLFVKESKDVGGAERCDLEGRSGVTVLERPSKTGASKCPMKVTGTK